MPILSFDEVIADAEALGFSKKHLILGNGFSIGCRADIFHYASLFEQADFSEIPEVRAAFEQLGSQDFEYVIRSLENAADLLPIYAPQNPDAVALMLKHAALLKDILVKTIADNHPEFPAKITDEEFASCQQFLSHFLGDVRSGSVFTLNYDLLLYWTLMHEEDPLLADVKALQKNDGFGNDENDPDADYVVWQGDTGARGTNIYYLHGALHLFDAGATLQKYTWIRKGVPLVDQARDAMENDKFPLFVAEGTSEQKNAKIHHNAYLYQCLKVLTQNANTGTHCFFMFGHSLAENDNHILKKLGRGRFKKLYVGIFGNPKSDFNQAIIASANALSAMRHERFPLEVCFFDSETAHVWR